jgi:uncharacterized Zn finger protein
VQIFLWEKDVEAAWQEAKRGVCSEELWLNLADRRAADHPADSLAICQRQALTLIGHTNNHAYEQAITLLGKIWPLYVKTHGQPAFDRYIAELRVAMKAKRNFIKMLDVLLQRLPRVIAAVGDP